MSRIARRSTAAVAALAAAVAALALSSASAQETPGARTLTFKELERGSTFIHVRNTRSRTGRSNAQGDQIVFTNPVTDAAGARTGTLHVACTTTTGARNFMRSTMACAGVLAVRDGTLTLQVLLSPGSATTTGAVTGGTGAYANARGTFVSRARTGGADDIVTLAP